LIVTILKLDNGVIFALKTVGQIWLNSLQMQKQIILLNHFKIVNHVNWASFCTEQEHLHYCFNILFRLILKTC